MKKIIVVLLVGVFLLTAVSTPTMAQGQGRGGFMGFIAGCCFGIRAAGEYNEGKTIHWREWCRLIPYIGGIFAIWDGIEGAGGMTTAEYSATYGATFY
ncbi:MAG: hypothetical protein KJ626_05915 [Verrucomicrobia bacterium]|nr:hypothetical protein [Verrucomicrobiota bacterium]